MLWGANFVVTLTFPYLLNALKGYCFVIYGAMCVLCLLLCSEICRRQKVERWKRLRVEIAGHASAS